MLQNIGAENFRSLASQNGEAEKLAGAQDPRTRPMQVSAREKPRPIPMPSNKDGAGPFLEA